MDSEPLLEQLPTAYAVAIRLTEAGHPDEVIADALGVPARTVPTLLSLACAKRDHLGEPEGDEHVGN